MIADEIQQIEGVKVDFIEYEMMSVFQYGTRLGTIQHFGSRLDIPAEINEIIDRYEFNLEAFLVENDIRYQIIKPERPNFDFSLDLFVFDWDDWFRPNSGTINGFYFCHHINKQHGQYIELIYKHTPYLSFSSHIPAHIKRYIDCIWQELEDTGYIRTPREISLGSKVANLLPDGLKAYKTDRDITCRVARRKNEYVYITRYRDCEWYVSPTENPQLMSKRSYDMESAVKEAIAMIENQS